MSDQRLPKENSRKPYTLEYAVWPGWRLVMQDAGIQTAPVLRRAQLPGDLFARQNVRLNSTNFFKLWEAIDAESASIDPDVPTPLRIAKVMTSDWFEPELFAALCSENMRCALERLAKYVKLIAPMVIRVEHTASQTKVTLDFIENTQTPPNVFLAFKLVFFVQLARLATRSNIQPLQVGLPLKSGHEADLELYKTFFGVPVSCTPLTTLVFTHADVEKPFLTENHKMWLFFEPSLRQRLADLDRSAAIVDRVRSILIEALPAGDVSMQSISRKLAVSTRTLQRKLQDEGTSFQQTLDSLRNSLAHHYLRNTEMSSPEISFLLGFEDANSFTRAFQGWTGKTPQTVRAELIENA